MKKLLIAAMLLLNSGLKGESKDLDKPVSKERYNEFISALERISRDWKSESI